VSGVKRLAAKARREWKPLLGVTCWASLALILASGNPDLALPAAFGAVAALSIRSEWRELNGDAARQRLDVALSEVVIGQLATVKYQRQFVGSGVTIRTTRSLAFAGREFQITVAEAA